MIVTMFANVYDNVGWEVDLTPADLLTLLRDRDAPKARADKERALAMTTCRFHGTRSKPHAYDATAIALDVDNGWDLFDAVMAADDLLCPYVIYQTTKHRYDHHRFRIVLILDRPVQSDEYDALWRGLAKRLAVYGCEVDPSTRDISRLSILPHEWTGDIAGLPPFGGDDWFDPVARLDGIPLYVDAILRHYRDDPVTKAPADDSTFWDSAADYRRQCRRMANATVDQYDLADLDTSPIVPQAKLEEEVANRNKSGRTFRFLCSVALKALHNGYPVDEPLLIDLGQQFSRRVGRKTDGLRVDARNALLFARQSYAREASR